MTKVEQANIRGLDIDKTAKGFAEASYIFKNYCQVTTASNDQIRWYQKTAGTLAPTSPQAISNTSPLATPATLEVDWTRNTSYVKEYKVEGFISDRDAKTADLDVIATTIRDLTLAIVKAVDADIWAVMSESQSPSNIQTFATTAVGGDQWDAADAAGNPIKDLLHARTLIETYDYDVSNLVCFMSPTDYENVVDWIFQKGAQIPSIAEQVGKMGKVSEIAGIKIVTSNNVTADYALVMVPQRATTFKQFSPTSAVSIDEPQMGKKIRVREEGIAYNTDPKAIVLISDTRS